MKCFLCPRNCGAERTEVRSGGVCGMPMAPVVARAMLHRWEEPCLTGKFGAGAVFFSGCNLRCIFCQNREISHDGFGQKISVEQLRRIFWNLIEQGAACLDLVTPDLFTPVILKALGDDIWPVPVVWNCSGYASVYTLKLLTGKIQIYLPDLKYAIPELSKRCSGVPDYFDYAREAIQEMFRQTGPYQIENGVLKSGVLIRHLILPGELENTRRCIDWVAETFRPGDILFSLMSQYTPIPQMETSGNLNRRVTAAEYRAAVAYMQNCGIQDGYLQERTAAKSEYTPSFDLQGILK